MSDDIKRKVIERLRYLSQPDSKPRLIYSGICMDIQESVCPSADSAEAKCLCSEIQGLLNLAFRGVRPGCNTSDPMGNYSVGNYWTGKTGAARRAFAGECADWLEHHHGRPAPAPVLSALDGYDEDLLDIPAFLRAQPEGR